MASPLEIIKEKKAQAIENIKSRGFDAAKRVYVGMATCEIAAGSKDVMEVFKTAIDQGLEGVYLSQKGCAGRCNLEPTVEIIEAGKLTYKYGLVSAEKAEQIVEKHLKNGQVINEWLI